MQTQARTPTQTTMWREECVYIQETTDSLFAGTDPLASFNGDPSCFVRYVEMQRNSATREGFDDAAQYIQHCLDDLEARGYRADVQA